MNVFRLILILSPDVNFKSGNALVVEDQIWCHYTSFDSSFKALSKIYWVEIDSISRSVAIKRKDTMTCAAQVEIRESATKRFVLAPCPQ